MWICAIDATESIPCVAFGRMDGEPSFDRIVCSIRELQDSMDSQSLDEFSGIPESWRDWLKQTKKEKPHIFPGPE